MRGIVADENCEGYLDNVVGLLASGWREEFWASLGLVVFDYDSLGWPEGMPDADLWRQCQDQGLVLLTINRKNEGPTSLEAAIQSLGTADSLPVVTLADYLRFNHEADYAEAAADKFLDILFDIDRYRGTGRLFIP